jgi:hypothetical protein
VQKGDLDPISQKIKRLKKIKSPSMGDLELRMGSEFPEKTYFFDQFVLGLTAIGDQLVLV